MDEERRDVKGLRTPKPRAPVSPTSTPKEKQVKVRESAVTMQLVKTKMCSYYVRGKCGSTECRFAHSQEELKHAPNLQKTKLCRNFLQGQCASGENCSFAHCDKDLRVTDGIYKTQICNFYERGYCKKGERCNHAHGNGDLRRRPPERFQRSPFPLAELLADNSESPLPPSSPWMVPISPVRLFDTPTKITPMWPLDPDMFMERTLQGDLPADPQPQQQRQQQEQQEQQEQWMATQQQLREKMASFDAEARGFVAELSGRRFDRI
uniref:C3H1-type domain-containing protein n=1 Tax=Noctiluca scintillans TaxID=2966 RepID=A0A7S1A8P4_NOCSC